MPITYEPIATFVNTTNTAPFVFTSIPQTYTDLRLVLNYFNSGDSTNTYPVLYFNNVTSGSLYGYRRIYGTGSTPAEQGIDQSNDFSPPLAVVDNNTIGGTLIMDLFNYTESGFKCGIFDHNNDINGTGWKSWSPFIFQSATAVTRIDVTTSNSFGAGTSATLYGILKA